MPTTYTNGLKLPDLGSIDWYNSYKNNIDILDPIVGTVNGVATTYAPISHNHDASEITSGTIDIARLPPAALERLHTVADQTARYALTTSTVQEGDTVKQTDTGVMYLVVDSTKLNSADGYTEYSAGTASKAIADEDGNSIKTSYGKLAGSQTWTGINAFTSPVRVVTNRSVPITENPSAEIVGNNFRFIDNNRFWGQLVPVWGTDGSFRIDLGISNWTATGNQGYWTLSTKIGKDFGTLSFYTSHANANLGTSTNQWASVYAQTYYYNGTEFQSKFVTTDTGQTITANKGIATYNATLALHNTQIELGAAPAYQRNSEIFFGDKNYTELGRIMYRASTDGTRLMWLAINDKYANGALSPTGTNKWNNFFIRTDPTGYRAVTFDTDAVIPDTNNINLGTATNQWKSVYSQTYYYNGTAWGLDKANEWSNINTFTRNVSDDFLMFKNTTINALVPTDTNYHFTDLNFYDVNSKIIGKVRSASTGARITTEITARSWSADGTTNEEVKLNLISDIQNSDKKTTINSNFIPSATNTYDLGTSTNKWKTLNGVNPGALGIPNKDSRVNIASEFTDLTGGNNYYIPPADGFVSINADTDIYCAVVSSTHNTTFWRQSAVVTSTGYASVTIPVRANLHLLAKIKSTGTIYAEFFPCLGNV